MSKKRKGQTSKQQAPKKQKLPPTDSSTATSLITATGPQTIICVLNEDGDAAFGISFTSSFTIEALKDAIHRAKFQKLKHLDPPTLKLYLIVLGDNDGTLEDVKGKVSILEQTISTNRY